MYRERYNFFSQSLYVSNLSVYKNYVNPHIDVCEL